MSSSLNFVDGGAQDVRVGTSESDMGTIGKNGFTPLAPRENESLHKAFEEAQGKSNAARVKANDYIAESLKWKEIADQILELLNKTRQAPQSKAFVKTVETVEPLRRERRPVGFWPSQIEQTLRAYHVPGGRGPTKRELKKLVLAKFSPKDEAAIWLALNVMIDRGKVKFIGPDCCYLPEHVPSSQVVTAGTNP